MGRSATRSPAAMPGSVVTVQLGQCGNQARAVVSRLTHPTRGPSLPDRRSLSALPSDPSSKPRDPRPPPFALAEVPTRLTPPCLLSPPPPSPHCLSRETQVGAELFATLAGEAEAAPPATRAETYEVRPLADPPPSFVRGI